MSISKLKDLKTTLPNQAAMEVKELLAEQPDSQLYFHNETHVKQVQKAAKYLSEAATLNIEDNESLQLAAALHAAGHLGGEEKYWEKSIDYASKFLKVNGVNGTVGATVKKLILALDPNQKPMSMLEKIFIDAHNSYYGEGQFMERLSRLHKEQEAFSKKRIDEATWLKAMLEQVKNHTFYTSQAARLFGKKKSKNIKELKKSLQQTLKVRLEEEKTSSISSNSGARTMFKIALRNHIDLTSIADQKANIMLSINALIITIGLPVFSTYLSGTRYLMVPAIVFLLTAVATMIIATLSTRPIKLEGETDVAKLLSEKTNFFFFGNFFRIPNLQYQEAIRKIVADTDYLDTSFVDDLYYLGIALGNKFRLLRLCYNVFVFGLCLSVLAFLVSYFIFPQATNPGTN
jgi:Family of unknown function (DUF5706)